MIGSRWIIVDGSHRIFSFGSNQAEAQEALASSSTTMPIKVATLGGRDRHSNTSWLMEPRRPVPPWARIASALN